MNNKNYSDNIYFPENITKWLNLLKNNDQRCLLSNCSETLTHAYKQAINLNALSILVPKEMGGANLNLTAQYYYYKHIAMTSGTLAFFCAQHIAAMATIALGKNLALKEKYVTQNLEGKYSFGVSFAHLRHTINPPVKATSEDDNSYIVNGTLSYVTGYKIFNTLVLGFSYNNKEIFAITPFCESDSMIVVKNLDLVAATSTNTVVCKLINHVIEKSMVIMENEVGTLASNSDKKVRHLPAVSMGLAEATLKLVISNEYLEMAQIRNAYNHLNKKFSDLENALLELPDTMPVTPLRVKVTDLLNKIFLFAEQIVKGYGTLEDNPLSVIRREAMIITASASNNTTLIETCEMLLKEEI